MPPQLMAMRPASASAAAPVEVNRRNRIAVLRIEPFAGGRTVIEKAQTREHQPVSLTRERCGQQGVALGVACETLRERDQFLTVLRRLPFHLGHGGCIHCRALPARLQPQLSSRYNANFPEKTH